jgi:ABC-type nitrate/sulfonate/bicarbonate transport system permease component
MQNAQAASRMDVVVIRVLAIGITGLVMNLCAEPASAAAPPRWRGAR